MQFRLDRDETIRLAQEALHTFAVRTSQQGFQLPRLPLVNRQVKTSHASAGWDQPGDDVE